MRGTFLNGVEVGDIQGIDAESVDVVPRQREAVAGRHRRASHAVNRLIRLPRTGNGVHSASGEQVYDANDAHGGMIAEGMICSTSPF